MGSSCLLRPAQHLRTGLIETPTQIGATQVMGPIGGTAVNSEHPPAVGLQVGGEGLDLQGRVHRVARLCMSEPEFEQGLRGLADTHPPECNAGCSELAQIRPGIGREGLQACAWGERFHVGGRMQSWARTP